LYIKVQGPYKFIPNKSVLLYSTGSDKFGDDGCWGRGGKKEKQLQVTREKP
jgi:hypothetical protein